MKKLLLFIAIILLSSNVIAQNDLYLVFEFMEVDNEQEDSYWETESFWEKIHEQRVKNGDIIGWDLWSLKPGGEDQGYQYLTVNLYNDPAKMFKGAGDFNAALKAAYPKMSQEQLDKEFNKTSKSRDLAKRYYLRQIDQTKDEFEMPIGTVAWINLIKAASGQNSNYEKGESEIFKPMHQKDVDDGRRGNWGLLRVMMPRGSERFASHITVDMFKDYDQVFMPGDNSGQEQTAAQQKAINDFIASRDLKWTYFATLVKKVR